MNWEEPGRQANDEGVVPHVAIRSAVVGVWRATFRCIRLSSGNHGNEAEESAGKDVNRQVLLNYYIMITDQQRGNRGEGGP